jgi:hypothetical protein
MREAQLPNVGVLDGIASANNFDPLVVGQYEDLLQASVESPGLLRAMGVTHVASDRSWPSGVRIHSGGPATFHRLTGALGRAWVVHNARQVPADDVLEALTDPAFDPSTEVLLVAKPPLDSRPRPTAGASRVLSLHDAPNAVTIRASLDAPGYLVLADTQYPGWQATVNGEPLDLFRANHASRAIHLEAGEHTIEMVYRPTSVLIGGTSSLAVLTLFVLGMSVSRRGSRQS